MVGFPNKPMGFPIILGCEMGVPPFKETPTSQGSYKNGNMFFLGGSNLMLKGINLRDFQ